MRLGISKKYAIFISILSLAILFTLLLSTGIVILQSADTLRNELRDSSRATYHETQHQAMAR